MRRQEEIESRQRYELEWRIERLDRNVGAARRAARIRAYVQATADRVAGSAPIADDCTAAKMVGGGSRVCRQRRSHASANYNCSTGILGVAARSYARVRPQRC
jgi:hypothetical protein